MDIYIYNTHRTLIHSVASLLNLRIVAIMWYGLGSAYSRFAFGHATNVTYPIVERENDKKSGKSEWMWEREGTIVTQYWMVGMVKATVKHLFRNLIVCQRVFPLIILFALFHSNSYTHTYTSPFCLVLILFPRVHVAVEACHFPLLFVGKPLPLFKLLLSSLRLFLLKKKMGKKAQ